MSKVLTVSSLSGIPPNAPPTAICLAIRRWAAALLLYLLATSLGHAAHDVLDPKSYTSPAGHYVLDVDPSHIDGSGPGTFRLVRDRQEVWRKTLPFTFRDSVVLDDGSSVGYFCDPREQSATPEGHVDAGPGAIHVVLLNPKGEVRRDNTIARVDSQNWHAPAEPIVRKLLLSPKQDFFTACVTEGEFDFWKTYRCATGKLERQFDIRKTAALPGWVRYVKAIEAIKGTPLVLVESRGAISKLFGAHEDWLNFTLVTHDGRRVWSQDVSTESGPRQRSSVADPARYSILQRKGGIIDATQSGQFDLWFFGESKRVNFSVTRDPKSKTGWQVQEGRRSLYRPWEVEEPLAAAPPNFSLPSLGTFKLQEPDVAPAGSIHDVDSFEFDREGRIGLLQGSRGGNGTFLLLDPEGHVQYELPLPRNVDGREIGNVLATSVSREKWVLVASEKGREESAWAWWLGPQEKSFGQPFALVCPEISALSGDGNGGFAVVARRRSNMTFPNELHGFDSQGAPAWTITGRLDGPEAFSLPEEFTITPRGEIVMLDTVGMALQAFDRSGKHLRTLDLKKSWRREPHYLAGLAPDVEEGFIVYDFRGDPPFVRTKPDGSVRQLLRPRHPNGRTIDPTRGLRAAPDGRIWACDGQALYRLDDQAVVDRTLGRDPRPDELGKIVGITADRQGRLYLVDERTGAVHIFDDQGRKLRVCRPAPADFSRNLSEPHVAAADDGSVFLQENLGGNRPPGILQFDPAGNRLEFKEFTGESDQRCYVQPGTKNLLITVTHFAGLIGPDGQVLKAVNRRADRRWLDYIIGVAFASDGSFAIESQSSENLGEMAITFFSPDATPVQTLPLPKWSRGLLGYNGTHFLLFGANSVEIYDRQGNPIQSFSTPVGFAWEYVLTRDGRELWCVNLTSRAVERFAMP